MFNKADQHTASINASIERLCTKSAWFMSLPLGVTHVLEESQEGRATFKIVSATQIEFRFETHDQSTNQYRLLCAGVGRKLTNGEYQACINEIGFSGVFYTSVEEMHTHVDTVMAATALIFSELASK